MGWFGRAVRSTRKGYRWIKPRAKKARRIYRKGRRGASKLYRLL